MMTVIQVNEVGKKGSSSLFTKSRWGEGRLMKLGYKQQQLGYGTDNIAERLSTEQSAGSNMAVGTR
jgi:hypothetical protein